MIRDRIVVGLQDVKLSEKLQMDSSLTLQTAIKKARQNESVKKQQEILRSGSTDPPASPEVDEVNEAKGRRDGRPHGPKEKNACVAAALRKTTRVKNVPLEMPRA